MGFIDKLRNKPEHIRKLILWIIVIIFALILGSFWFYNSWWRIRNFPKQEILKELDLPDLREK